MRLEVFTAKGGETKSSRVFINPEEAAESCGKGAPSERQSHMVCPCTVLVHTEYCSTTDTILLAAQTTDLRGEHS